jgi:hypothetical protein
MGLQRERLPGGALALVGVLLALPSVVAPTWHVTTSARDRGGLLFEEWDWSWGRSRLEGAGGLELQELWNGFGLAVFLVLLVVAAIASAQWVRSHASWAALAGPVGVAALAGRLVTTAADRHSRTVREQVYGLVTVTDTPGAGVLESLAAIVLLAALAVMAFTLVRGDPMSAVRSGLAGTIEVGGRHPSTSVGFRPEGEHLSGTPVAFGEAVDEEGRR